MRIPPDAIIPADKLTRYLLVFRDKNDKSLFLAQAGFILANANQLQEAILSLSISTDAIEDGKNEYGIFYRVEGNLKGPNGYSLPVILIWIQWYIDNSFHFVTLKPLR